MPEILSSINSKRFDAAWYDMAGAGHFWIEWRALVLESQIKQLPIDKNAPLRVLDIGGGQGVLRKQIEAMTNWTVDCVDIDMLALEQAEPSRGRTLYYDIFDKKSELLGAYDIVVVYDVIEHLPEPRKFLESAVAHAKPSGSWLLLNVPALQCSHSRYDEAIGHLRRYNRSTLRAELPSGFASKEERYWGFTLLPILFLRKILLKFSSGDQQDIVKKGFKPPSPLVNLLFSVVAKAESLVFPHPPLGTSVMLAAFRSEK